MTVPFPAVKPTTHSFDPLVELRLKCLVMAQDLNPKDAGDLIKKAAGIYNWVTREDKPND